MSKDTELKRKEIIEDMHVKSLVQKRECPMKI